MKWTPVPGHLGMPDHHVRYSDIIGMRVNDTYLIGHGHFWVVYTIGA